jgi:hypothetical protein
MDIINIIVLFFIFDNKFTKKINFMKLFLQVFVFFIPLFALATVEPDASEIVILEAQEISRTLKQRTDILDGYHYIYWWELFIHYKLKLMDDSTIDLRIREQAGQNWNGHSPLPDSLSNLYHSLYLDVGDILRLNPKPSHYEWRQGWGTLTPFSLIRNEELVDNFDAFVND